MFAQDPELVAAFFFIPTYHLCNESSTVIATWWEIIMLRPQLVINLIWGYLTASCNKFEISELAVYEKLFELAIWKTLTMGISSGHHWNRFLSCTYYCLYYIDTRPTSCWDNIKRSTALTSLLFVAAVIFIAKSQYGSLLLNYFISMLNAHYYSPSQNFRNSQSWIDFFSVCVFRWR